jgi:hypothetical protein
MTPKHIMDRDAGTLTYDFDAADAIWKNYELYRKWEAWFLEDTNEAWAVVKDDIGNHTSNPQLKLMYRWFDESLHKLDMTREMAKLMLAEYNACVGTHDAAKA